MPWYRIVRRRRKRASSVTKHYLEHKEKTRELVLERLSYWNEFYGYTYNRVAVRNQRRCWGSCSAKGNLNFSYKLLFLPPCLSDYVILHELCHLKELNHSARFWALMEKVMPDYRERVRELKRIERRVGTAATHLEKEKAVHTCVACSGTPLTSITDPVERPSPATE